MFLVFATFKQVYGVEVSAAFIAIIRWELLRTLHPLCQLANRIEKAKYTVKAIEPLGSITRPNGNKADVVFRMTDRL